MGQAAFFAFSKKQKSHNGLFHKEIHQKNRRKYSWGCIQGLFDEGASKSSKSLLKVKGRRGAFGAFEAFSCGFPLPMLRFRFYGVRVNLNSNLETGWGSG